MLIVLRSINPDIKSRDEYSQTLSRNLIHARQIFKIAKDVAKYLLYTWYVLDMKVSRSRSYRSIYTSRGGGGVKEFVFAFLTTISASGDIVFTLTVA